MGLCARITFILLAVLVAYVYQTYHKFSKPLEAREIDTERYWGPGKAVKDDTKIVPFKIEFSDANLEKLKTQLSDTSGLVPPLEDAKFHYGFNSNKLKSVLKYWKESYLGKWTSERLPFLNQFPQFTTQIQGLKIHFIHVVPKPTKPSTKVLPLLLAHGWPGSVREFYELIPLLTKESSDRDFVFEVIAPSLPGYGFSEAASKQGLNAEEIGVIFRNLMLRLGKTRFYVQGGDWGSLIVSTIATYFPDNVIGHHSNMCFVNSPIGMVKAALAENIPQLFFKEQKDYYDWFFPFKTKFFGLLQESGYMHIQATKPDTIGVSLSNNPIGLAAYILEKFSTWTNPNYRDLDDGGLEKYFTLDALLDNLMFYYIPNSITSSQRLYKESFSDEAHFDIGRIPTSVPTGCARFKFELAHTIDWVLKDKYLNLIHTSYYHDGGHFASMQLPEIMAKDFVAFVKKVEK